MLKFIDENDFLLVDTYKENEDGSVSWVYNEGEGLPTHSGVIRPGFTRKDAGDDEIDVWQTMLNKAHSGEIFIQWLTQEDKDAIATEQQIQAFKSNRQNLLDSAVVTTSNSNQYDADESSISRMANAILAAQDAGITELSWSLADTGTGVMTSVTLADIKEAHRLAVQNMANIWSVG
ncbi:MAG: hypothetical protein AAF364_09270 [Pseudomonadota bacterium]